MQQKTTQGSAPNGAGRGIKRPRLSIEQQIEIIWQAAEVVLQSHGYSRTTMSAIAKQARMSKETLYNLFVSKEELFARLIENKAMNMNKLIEQAINSEIRSLPIALQEIGSVLLQVLTSDSSITVNQVAIASISTDNQLAQILQHYGRASTMEHLQCLMEKAFACGELGGDSPELAGETFIALIIGDLQIRRCLGNYPALQSEEAEQRAAQAVQQFMRLFAASDNSRCFY